MQNTDIIIQQAEFDKYSNDWIEVVSNDDSSDLIKCFRLNQTPQNINYVYFSALQIAQLLSTVGAQNIKARFLVVRDITNYPHFALALFATDDLNGRLSAYYISVPYWLQGEGAPGSNGTTLDVLTPVSLPDALATYWQQNWSPVGDDPDATQDMFNSTYGYLRGYTFQLDDFLSTLKQIPAGVSIQDADFIRINFGLHEYYPATANVTETRSTFGLLVSYSTAAKRAQIALAKVDAATIVAASDDDDMVFYDLAHPCPPTC